MQHTIRNVIFNQLFPSHSFAYHVRKATHPFITIFLVLDKWLKRIITIFLVHIPGYNCYTLVIIYSIHWGKLILRYILGHSLSCYNVSDLYLTRRIKNKGVSSGTISTFAVSSFLLLSKKFL